jgi:Tfp pilus assembly protein PilO
MTRTRKWVTGTAVLVLIVLAAGWFLLVSPKKSDAATLQQTALAQAATNDGLRVKVAALKAANAQIPQQEAKLATFHQQVPETPAEPALVRQLSALAKQSGMLFEVLNAANPAGLNVASAPVAAKDNSLNQMSITMTVEGSYYSAERFLDLLESMKRVMIVTGISGNTTSDVPGDLTIHKFTINARVFTTTTSGAPAAGATSTAPASGNASPTKVQ